MQESDTSAKVRQSCFSDPFSLQSKQLQPDYVSSYLSNFPAFLSLKTGSTLRYDKFQAVNGYEISHISFIFNASS